MHPPCSSAAACSAWAPPAPSPFRPCRSRALPSPRAGLTIAYNVNLPSWDPTVGPRPSTRPSSRSTSRSSTSMSTRIPTSLQTGPPHRLGLERGPDQGRHRRARGRQMARRVARDPRGRRLVARARRQGRDRQPDPVHVAQGRQLQDRRQPDHRRRAGIRADLLQVDGLPHQLRPAQGLLREGRPRRLRGEAVGSGPYMVDAFERNAFLRLKAFPDYWGGKPAFETVVFKFVPEPPAASPRSSPAPPTSRWRSPTRSTTASAEPGSPATRPRSPTSR